MLCENQCAFWQPSVSWEKLEIQVTASEKELYPGCLEKPAGSSQHALEALNHLLVATCSVARLRKCWSLVGLKACKNMSVY